MIKLLYKRIKHFVKSRRNPHVSSPHSTFHIPHSNTGFTLVEMIVTVGIFAVISSIILARNAAFDTEVLLNNLAYDVALSVRKAQQFGINVRVSEGLFDRPYGIHFTKNTNTYIFFADKDNDMRYDGPTESVETYTLGRGSTVSTLCDVGRNICTLTDLTIVFRRPDPDAIMAQGTISQARVEIREPRGGKRYIAIESTGQISVQK